MQTSERIERHAKPFSDLYEDQEQRAACRKLWEAVLIQALKDCSGRPVFDAVDVAGELGIQFREFIQLPPKEKVEATRKVKGGLIDSAIDWVMRADDGVGSCAWICKTLGYDHVRIKDVAESIHRSGFNNHVKKSGASAVRWHVENSAPTYQKTNEDWSVGYRRTVKLHEETEDV